MSEPLKKLEKPMLDLSTPAELYDALNAAIDRINELEAKYEGHTHGYYKGHHPESDFNNARTSIPVAPKLPDNGESHEK